MSLDIQFYNVPMVIIKEGDEMKFRAYDKQEKKLYKPDTMGELFYLFALTMDGRLGRFNEDLGKYETCDSDRYVVEKYSSYCGHYEGDKFSVKLNSEETVTMILVFKRDRFELACYRGEAYFTLETGYIDSPDVKHIGNIHDGEADGKD